MSIYIDVLSSLPVSGFIGNVVSGYCVELGEIPLEGNVTRLDEVKGLTIRRTGCSSLILPTKYDWKVESDVFE